ncbi:uncharacterized protein PHALS_05281 [Plasmopara halstedii]|uniref:Golgin-84 n=1 Tax=Plasmopara halstedii TaxID=4781 RepID=A0A0P1AAE9_PLAHL|nr:uncharacterized protein PHALS_05281 [Plasmopara halstedii]CEG37500.1 hypothetical protein PHALS_05281 [Plasmopara halstedii]|eukprot:XP_024573869.1 hypothetical protein PHALS_05281 [Plasmopara halstedii]
MNWVSSSLELAGSLLESVDQQAALTLAGGDEKEHKVELLVSRTSDENSFSNVKNKLRDDSTVEKIPISIQQDGSSISGSSHSNMADNSTNRIPLVNSGKKLAGLVSVISTQLENVSSGRGEGSLDSSSAQLVLAGNDYAGLQKDLVRAKNELRAKEKQLSNTQKSMKSCEEELLALEKECEVKIAQVQHEMSIIQQDKKLEEAQFIQALEIKDKQIRAMKADVAALTEVNVQYTDEIALLKVELAKAVESKDTLWTSAASASNESEHLVESLRSELQETLTAMTNLKREYAESKNIMFARQVQLESMNTELVNNVANLERELAKTRETVAPDFSTKANVSFSHVGAGSNVASMTDDFRRVQQTLTLTKKSLQDESRKNESQKQEIAALTEEILRLKQVVQTAQESSMQKLDAAYSENKMLRGRVDELTAHHSTIAAGGGESRIQQLTNRLIKKQETIDLMHSRVTTMDLRLQDVMKRAQRAEERLAQMGMDDMEMASFSPRGTGARRARPLAVVPWSSVSPGSICSLWDALLYFTDPLLGLHNFKLSHQSSI